MSVNSAAAGVANTPPTADSSEPVAVMRNPGERFTCRVSIENFGLSVEATPDVTAWGTHLCWEELQVRCEYSGVVQKTRWMPLPLALEQMKQKQHAQTAPQDDGASASDADSSLCLDDEPSYGAGEQQHPAGATAAGAAPKARAVKLDYSTFDNCSFEVEFTSGNEAAAGDAGATATRQVRRKRGHRMALSVEAQNLKRLFSTTGGRTGDQKPTSANKEAINAAFQKGAAKFSAWARGAFNKKSTKKELEAKEREKLEEEALMQGATQAAPVVENTHADGTYMPVALPNIDFSEAFNAPGGRKRYHLVVKPGRSKLPQRGEGVPLLVAFTVVAHYTGTATAPVPRNFHSYVFVMDQFALNASEAAEVSMPTKRHGSAGDAEEVPRKVVGYGYAFTTNTAHSAAPMAASRVISLDVTKQADGHCTRVIDFTAQHRTHDEHQLTAADYQDLPTTACIVSSDCLVANPERVGHRVLCVSRYKTSSEGLCKPSYKCRVTFTLTRQYENGDVEHETSEAPIDLSAMLNQELFTSRDREVHFSFGEILYMRLRRFCFDKPELHVAPLLLPFDYDNTGVVVHGVCGPVASWTRRKAAAAPPAHAQNSPASHNGGPAAPVYGADEVGEMPVNESREDDADSTSSAPSIDPNNPFCRDATSASPPPSQEPDSVNPFMTSNAGADEAPTMTFTFGDAEESHHVDPQNNVPPPANDDFFMDDWGTEPAQKSEATFTADTTYNAGANMFSMGGDSHVHGSRGDGHGESDENNGGTNMFSTESRPAFVLEPMAGEDNALDWTKWGQ